MDKLSHRINNLSGEDKKTLDALITVEKVKKGQLIFDETALDLFIYYVEKGLMRKYVIKNDNEKTLDFYFTDDLYFPLQPNRNTNSYLQALEETTLYKLNTVQFDQTKSDNESFLKLEIAILEAALFQSNERLEQFQTMTATERYLTLLERNPKIVQNIALTYVASYLGINNASLSKIRSKLK